jgi:RHS repeat-associated protein
MERTPGSVSALVGGVRFAVFSGLALPAVLLWAPAAQGAFTDATAARLPTLVATAYRIAAADCDGDGDEDLLLACAGQCRLLRNDGAGTFADITAAALPAASETTLASVFADVDADGDLDLVLGNYRGRNRLLLNDGTGSFADVSAARLPDTASLTVALACGDVDGDGDPDLVAACRGDLCRVFVNTAGSFADQTASRLPGTVANHSSAVLFDADADGDLDLFAGVERGQCRLWRNSGTGVFTETTAADLPQAARATQHAVAVDVDGDGDPDLVLAEDGDGLRLLLNDGSGHFADGTAGRLPALNSSCTQIVAADIDVAGDLDLVAVGLGQTALLLNDGSGHFTDATAALLPADTERTFGAAAVDVDGDLDPDLVLARPQAQPRLWLNAMAEPRVRLTVAPALVEVGSPVTIAVLAVDEDGIASVEATVNGTPVVLAGGTAQYVPDAPGAYTVLASARDTLGNSSAVRRAGFAAVANLVPVVDAGPNATIFRGGTYAASGSFADTGAGPWTATVDYGDGSGLQPLALAPDKTFTLSHVYAEYGTYTVTVAVSDGVAVGTDTALVAVVNQPPVLSPIPGQVVQDPVAFTPISLDAYVADPDHADAEIAWTATGAAALQVAVDAGRIARITYAPGTRVTETLTFTATDPLGGSASVSAEFTVAEPSGDYLRPYVTVAATPAAVGVNTPVTLTVTVTDASPILSRALTVNGTPLLLDDTGHAVFSSPTPGVFMAVATAMDNAGNQGYAETEFRVLVPGDTTPPVAEITAPAELAEISEKVQIVGSATDAHLMRYTLAYAASGDSAFVPFASGTEPVAGGALGALDVSVLRNGSYDLRLTVEDTSGNSATALRRIVAVGQAKPGLARLRFRDLNVAGAGVDLCILRSYDSQNKRKGDFGIGWTLGLNDFQLHESGPMGADWVMAQGGGAFTVYTLAESAPHYVTVRYPDDSVETFRFAPTPLSNLFIPSWDLTAAFQAEPASRASLVPVGDTLVQVTPGPGDVQLEEWGFAGLYDPDRYRLTTRHGYVYVIHKVNGVETIRDPYDNTLTFGVNGITHSCGRSVGYVRDGEGRITSISDPAGHALHYEYDAYGDLVAFTDQEGRVTCFRYDSRHNLRELIGPAGQCTLRQEYDAAGRLISVTGGEAGRTEFLHDTDARTEAVRDPYGRLTRYTYDALGNVTAVTDPLGNTATFAYDAEGRLLAEADPMGHAWTYGRDASGRATTLTTPDGGVFALGYDGAGRLATVTDPLGHTEQWTYDAHGRLSSVADPLGNTRSWTYDAEGHLSTAVDPLGNLTRYERNAFGDVSRIVYPDGSEQVLGYDANGNITGVSTPRTLADGSTRVVNATIEYDGLQRVTARVAPGGRRYEYRYTPSGRIESIVAPDGQPLSTVRRGTTGEVISERPGAGNRTTHYSLTGVPQSRVDRLGRTTRYAYDARDSLTQVTKPSGETLQLAHDAAGRPREVIYPSGLAVAFEHNAVGQVAGIALPDGRNTRFAYDRAFNLSSSTDAAGRVVSNTRDAAGRVTQLTLPDGANWGATYDANGRVTRLTTPDGRATGYAYDQRGRLTAVTDALGGTTRYGYDEVGNLVRHTDAVGRATTYGFNDAWQMTERTLPLGQSESWAYDARGRIVSHTAFDGHSRTYVYGADGSLAEVRADDGSVTAFTRLANGMVLAETDAAGTSTFEYDLAERLVRETGPNGQAVSYTYGPGGRLASVTSIAGTVTYTYDAEGRMQTVTDPEGGVTAYTYNAVGKLTGLALPNGVRGTFEYDQLDRPVRLEYRSAQGAVLASFVYAYDAAGRVASVLEASGRLVEYTYDAVGRLTAERVTVPGSAASQVDYTYDAVGNRLSRAGPEGTVAYLYDANHRLTQAGDATYSYDANGRLTGLDDGHGRVLAYSYDSAGQLTRLAETANAQTHTLEMTYGAGARTCLTVDGSETHRYVVSTNGPLARILAELDADGNVIASYVYGVGLVRRQAGDTRYYLPDAGESVRLLTDTLGNVTDTYAYDAFGSLAARQGTSANPFLFTGDQLDPVSGLYFLRSRYYDPSTGRFLSPDPAPAQPAPPGTDHPYRYADSSPVHRVDHTGAFWTTTEMLTAVSVLGVLTAANAMLISSDWHPFSHNAVYDGINDTSGIENLQRDLDEPSFGGTWVQMGSSYSWDFLSARSAGSVVVSRAWPWELKVAVKHRTVDIGVAIGKNPFTGLMAVRDPVRHFALAVTEAGAPSDYSPEAVATVEDAMEDAASRLSPYLRLLKPTAGFSIGMGLMTTRDAYSSSTLDGLSVGLAAGVSANAGPASMGIGIGASLGVNAGEALLAGDLYNGAWTVGVNLTGGAGIGGSWSYADGTATLTENDQEWGTTSWSFSFTASYALREWRFLPKAEGQ